MNTLEVRLYMSGGRTTMDLITQGMLDEFVQDRELGHLTKDKQFEHLAAFLSVYRNYREAFDTDDVVTGGGGDGAIDGVAIIVNGVLLADIDDYKDQFDGREQIDATFIFIQADSGPSFDTGKMGKFGDGVRDFFRDTVNFQRNEAIENAAAVMKEIYRRPSRFTNQSRT